jgi:hypothetical protein
MSYRVTSMVLGVAIAGLLLFLIRKDQVHPRYAAWWLLTATAALVFGAFPHLVDRVGSLLGVSYPPILLVVVSLGMILVKMLTMDLDRSRQQREIRRMAQRIALLEGAGEPSTLPVERLDAIRIKKR